jgi:DNA-binding transcriptional regulator YiaG
VSRLSPADAIRFHAARGMSRRRLEEVYHPSRVSEVLGADPAMVEARAAKAREEAKTFAARIRKAMHDLRCTISKFATLCGVERHAVEHWRDGISMPVNRRIIARVASVLNMEPETLARDIAAERGKMGVGPKTGIQRRLPEAAE